MKKLKVYIDTSVIGGCFDNFFKNGLANYLMNLSQEKRKQ